MGKAPLLRPKTLYRSNCYPVRVIPFYCLALAAIVEGVLQRIFSAQIRPYLAVLAIPQVQCFFPGCEADRSWSPTCAQASDEIGLRYGSQVTLGTQ